MYEHLMNNYRVFFEGLPEPVFYGHFYPMGDKGGPYSQALWSEFNYCRGLKEDKDPDQRYLHEFAEAYERDLRNLLNAVWADSRGKRRGVVVIPSSTRGAVNRVTELTRRVLASNPSIFADLTPWVTRTRSKEKAHVGGSRSYEESYDTIEVDQRGSISQYEILLVLDDVLTTGLSFRAMDDKLRDSGFTGTLFNYAFSHTIPGEGAAMCMAREADCRWSERRWERACRDESLPVEAVVFDLDQTLIDDSVRDEEYEEGSPRGDSDSDGGTVPYPLYDGVKGLMRTGVPYAIVSNRSRRWLGRLLQNQTIADELYPDNRAVREGSARPLEAFRHESYYGSERDTLRRCPRNVFSFPTEDNNGYVANYYKPSPRGVLEALGYLRREFLYERNDARIIGVGNTYEDMVAYDAAGIESVLALWGVPDAMKRYARCNWGADYVFESAHDFYWWLVSRDNYYETAASLERSDSRAARAYYNLALRAEDHVWESALALARDVREGDARRAIQLCEIAIDNTNQWNGDSYWHRVEDGIDPVRAKELYGSTAGSKMDCYALICLAFLVTDDDPERAKLLYERAIEAGDELYATNCLAALLRYDDPTRAKALFERSIDAGDEYYATENLALLLGEEDPRRAIALLERAAVAGNDAYLDIILNRHIMNGNTDAVALYMRFVVAGNSWKARNLSATISRADPTRAIPLYEAAIEAGDEYYAALGLARLIRGVDPQRAVGLIERAMEERPATGEYLNYREELKPIVVGGCEEAIILYERLVEEGLSRWDFTKDLRPLINAGDESAIALFERIQIAGDDRRAYMVADLLADRDPERAALLYRRAIAAGEERFATRGLARLIGNRDPLYATTLLRSAASAGNSKEIEKDLDSLILAGSEDAIRLYTEYVIAGDEEKVKDLANLIAVGDPVRAALLLYDHVIAAAKKPQKKTYGWGHDMTPDYRKALLGQAIAQGGERHATNELGELVADDEPERAKSLFERAIAAGNELYATYNLANLIRDTDPERAKILYERAIAAGNKVNACNALGTLIAEENLDEAVVLFERSKAIRDNPRATCNLGHVFIASDPAKASEFYTQSIAQGETEALIGLAFLLRETDRGRSDCLLERARSAGDRAKSVRSLIKLIGCADVDTAMDVARFLCSNGFDEAANVHISMVLGKDVHPSSRRIHFGVAPDSGVPIEWIIIESDFDSVLLLSKDSLASMPFDVGVTSASWDDSEVRKWMNGEFVNTWLEKDDRSRLIPQDNLGDLVSCLSYEEARSLARRFENVLFCKDLNTSAPTDWWLRPEKGDVMSVPYISFDGEAGWKFAQLPLGVRPMVRIDLGMSAGDGEIH